MYCINPQDDEPIFLLDCQIGRDESRPDDKFIDGKDFARELMYMDGEGKKRMWVYINSPGGDVAQGEDIQGAILLSKTKVNTLCYGEAASISGVIFQAGYKRVMLESARLMYHDAYMEGKVSEGDKKSLHATNEALAKMISARSWKDIDGVKKMMAQTTYINAEDALASDLCDEIKYNGELNAPKTTDAKARWEYGNKILNKVLPTIKNNTMSKVINKTLGLNEEASEAATVEALQKILNKKNEDESELDKTKKALAKAEDEMAKAKKKIEEDATAAKAKADEEAKAKSEAEESDKKAKAKAKILETIKNRGVSINDKAIESYVNLASDDKNLASVIETIESIPVTKKAVIVNLAPADKDAAFTVDAAGDVVDTEKIVAHMNKTVLNKSKTRFS